MLAYVAVRGEIFARRDFALKIEDFQDAQRYRL
jgi:hypothetical protein